MKIRYVTIHNVTQPSKQPVLARYCNSFLCRLRGLMFVKELPKGMGLLLVQSRDSRLDSAIHMFFMRMDIAAVWISDAGEVVDVRHARRWSPGIVPQKPARYVLEIPLANRNEYRVGDKVRFEEAWLD
jgi:uncharacterized membrane protein (UPF0127 family)